MALTEISFSKRRLAPGLAAGISLLAAACSPVQQLQSVASAGGALVNSVAATGEQVSLDTAQLRQLQLREFPATKAAAFASVMTVLLDSGYRVLSADLESGLITAAAATTGRLRLDTGGLGRANLTPLASAYVEQPSADAVRVRVSFSIGRSATGALAGTGETTVLDQRTYAAFFEQLREEIAQRPRPADQVSHAQEKSLVAPDALRQLAPSHQIPPATKTPEESEYLLSGAGAEEKDFLENGTEIDVAAPN